MKRIMLLGALFCLCLGSASAQNFIEKGDSLYDVIVTNSDVDITFVNDTLHPWSVENDAAIIRGKSDCTYSTSWLTMSFIIEEKSELSFEWANYNRYDHDALRLYINGDYNSFTNNSSYNSRRFILEPGEYVFAFRDSLGGNAYNYITENWSTIKNVQIKRIVPPNYNPIVTVSDVDTITFTNDNWMCPWNMEDNVAIIRGKSDCPYSTSWLTMSFNLEERSELSFEWASYNYYDHDALQLYINGIYNSNTNNSSYTSRRFVLEPGEYVFAFRDSTGSNYNNWNINNWSAIKNVKINKIVPPNYNPIVTISDVDTITFTNSNWMCSWNMEDNVAIIRSKSDCPYSTSWLTMSFNLEERSELSFEWASYNYHDHDALQLYINGIYNSNTNNSSYTSRRFFLEPGEYVFAFRDSTGSNYNNWNINNWSAIKNVKIKAIRPLETVVLTHNSLPLTFTNNSAIPWTTEDGYITHENWGERNSGSSFTTTFTLDKTSKFSFYRRISVEGDTWYNRESTHNLFVCINGIQISKDWANTNFDYWCIVLEPGEYTIDFKDTVYYDYGDHWYYSQIKDIELSNNWITCELATAGTLGVEVLYQVNVLNDVEMLKVVGPMNSSDWTDIKNMTNLKALDLSEAVLTEIPNNAFDGKGWINSVILPEGIKSIGEYAFRGTSIRRINIPSTVTTIRRNAFISTPLQSLTFAEGSQIRTIEKYAFQSCSSLQEVVLPNGVESIGYCAFELCSSISRVEMPNTVTWLGAGAFSRCPNMKSIRFSDALTELPEWVCVYANSLTDVHFPVNLTRINNEAFLDNTSLRHIDIPNTVNTIVRRAFYNCGVDSVLLPTRLQYLGTEAFSHCNNLTYIEFPSYIERGSYSYCYSYGNDGDYKHWDSNSSGYCSNFTYCPNIETIVMRSAAPPINDADAFAYSRAKSEITLKVPSFAVVNYKLDTYWYQFGSIVEGDDVDYWRIVNPLSLTNNRRMQGKPDIDLYYGGQFTVGGNAPMETGLFNYYVSESNPGRLLNTCDAMTADSMNTYFSVSANTWYFICPIHDVDLTKVSVSNGASYVFRYYDGSSRATNGTGNSWRNVDSGKLLAGQGYIFRSNVDAIITMPTDADGHKAMFNTADVTKQLSEYEAAASANKSWNYVGNPYPCYYDIYYMDYTAPITVWTGSTYKAYSLIDDNYALRPMQSFFVQKPDAVDNIVFHKEGRQLTADINHASSASNAPARSSRFLFDLVLSNDSESDETRVVINDNASMGYELERDASKFMSIDASVPQLFTLDMANNSYAINERPLDNGLVRMAYSANQSGYLTISASRLDGDLFITDNQTEKTVNLKEQDYTFHTNATNGVDVDRFTLTLMPANNGETFVKEQHQVSDEQSPVFDILGRKMEQPLENGLFIQDGKIIMK